MQGIVFRPEIAKLLLGMAFTRIARKLPVFPGGPVALETLRREELPGGRWVRVRSHLAGICGTDLSLLALKFSPRAATMARNRSIRAPRCLGHEVCGRVIETGPEVCGVSAGQRVVFVPGTCCRGLDEPECPLCAEGFPLLCLRRDDQCLSLSAGGGWSTEFVRHESQVLPIADSISDDEAVLIEPLASSLHAVLRRLPAPDDSVIVVGCGMIGIGMIMVLRALGSTGKIIAVCKHDFQSSAASEAGANSIVQVGSGDAYEQIAAELQTPVLGRRKTNRMLQNGAAVVYDAVGTSATVHDALRWTRPRGAVVVEGISAPAASFDFSPVWLREIDLLGAHGHGMESRGGRRRHTFQFIMEMMEGGKLTPASMITHRFPLSQFAAAINTAEGKVASGAIKVLLQMPLHD